MGILIKCRASFSLQRIPIDRSAHTPTSCQLVPFLVLLAGLPGTKKKRGKGCQKAMQEYAHSRCATFFLSESKTKKKYAPTEKETNKQTTRKRKRIKQNKTNQTSKSTPSTLDHHTNHSASWDLRTKRRDFFLKASRSFRHMTAASILAGDSSFGSESIETTETMIPSTPRIGRQRSSAVSCSLNLSSPGGCRIEMHTLPSGYTLGWNISLTKVMVGGLFGKSFGNSSLASKNPFFFQAEDGIRDTEL